SLVFVHGAGANLGMWHPQVERLSDQFRCIAIDLPGHGVARASRFTLEAGVEAVRRAIDEHAGGAATVVGLSLGAYVGIATAAAHPERVSALVSSGAGVEFQGLTAWVNRFQGLLMPLAGPLLNRMAAKSLARIAPPGTEEALEKRGNLSLRGAGQALRDLAGRDFRALLVQYPGPVLALMGVRDKHNVAALPTMIEGMANVEVEIIQDGGHSCSLSQPDAFSDAIRRFVGQRN
ncbi:MAG: alpha/beta hydrolase, partial [Acidimicrobiia bacterium]|nr:alpha/beta hydrolase [Acidimicrobiia bacterium]